MITNDYDCAFCLKGLVNVLPDQTHSLLYRPLGYERVYVPLCKVIHTPFYIQCDELYAYYYQIIRVYCA